MPERRESFLRKEQVQLKIYIYFLLCLLLLSFATVPVSADTGVENQQDNWDVAVEYLQDRIAPVHNLNEFDLTGDGMLEIVGHIKAGDIIYRPHDGETQIEEGEYVVPNNLVFLDNNGDGVLDAQPTSVKLVSVIEDNLTWLFEENSNNVVGVFPNGTGRSGANTVPSVRRVSVILGEAWGQAESERLGFAQNAFGVNTLGTQFYISDEEMVYTSQEIHGTPPEWDPLLGTTVSGGCIRHRNRDIQLIRQHMRESDIVLTMQTAQDDEIDNPMNLANLTRVAAEREMISLPENIEQTYAQSLLLRPTNHDALSTLPPLDTTRWITFDQVKALYPHIELPNSEIIAHPYTRGEYSIIPCGSETLFLFLKWAGIEPILETEEGFYRLNVAPTLYHPNGNTIAVTDFYYPTTITHDDLADMQSLLSRGEDLQVFEYLYSDFAFQYAVWVAARSFNMPDLLSADLQTQGAAVMRLSDQDLREVQLVTGLIPIDFRWGVQRPSQVPGDFLTALRNRTLIHSAMNPFAGTVGEAYELDFRLNEPYGLAVPITDMDIQIPSPDHEMIRLSGAHPQEIRLLMERAMEPGSGAIFRVTQFALHTTPIRYSSGLAQAHYFVLVPQLSNLEQGEITVFDSMNPSGYFQLRLEEVANVFSTITVMPARD
jgi:hypothetical protein